MKCIKQISTMIFVFSILIIAGRVMSAENSTSPLNQYQLDTPTATTIDALKTQRTYSKDIRGYTQKEIDLAINILTGKLYPQKKELEERIKMLKLAKANVTDKGYWRDEPKSGLEKQYNDTVEDIKKAQIDLEKLNHNIYNQEIIAGIRRSAFVKTVIGAIAIGAALSGMVVADYFFNDSSMRYRLSGKYQELEWSIFLAGGLKNYLYNWIVDPYNIKQPSELNFWNRKLQEWQPVEGNEELAKKSLIVRKEEYGFMPAGPYGDLMTSRGGDYFWDPLMNVFRQFTLAERHAGLAQKHELERVFKDYENNLEQ